MSPTDPLTTPNKRVSAKNFAFWSFKLSSLYKFKLLLLLLPLLLTFFQQIFKKLIKLLIKYTYYNDIKRIFINKFM